MEHFSMEKPSEYDEDKAHDEANLMLAQLESEGRDDSRLPYTSEDYENAFKEIQRLKKLQAEGLNAEKLKTEAKKIPTRIKYILGELGLISKQGNLTDIFALSKIEAGVQLESLKRRIQHIVNKLNLPHRLNSPDKGFEEEVNSNITFLHNALESIPAIVDEEDNSPLADILVKGEAEGFEGQLLLSAPFQFYVDRKNGKIYEFQTAGYDSDWVDEYVDKVGVVNIQVGYPKNWDWRKNPKNSPILITQFSFQEEAREEGETDESFNSYVKSEEWKDEQLEGTFSEEAKKRIKETISRWNSLQGI